MMSEMVKQVVYSEFGDPTKVLQVEDVARDVLEVGQARADVLRSPINPSDLIQISEIMACGRHCQRSPVMKVSVG